jgi:hypothetical protein
LVILAGHISWMAALKYAPITMARPMKKVNSRNAIGVARAPYV